MKKIILLMLLVLFTIPNKGLSMQATEIQDIDKMNIPKIDTSNWITHPVGRYLIKLPPTVKIQRERLRYNENSLYWEKDLTIQEAQALLKEKYLELIKDDSLNVEYNDNYGPYGLGCSLAYVKKEDPTRPWPESIPECVYYDIYVVNNKSDFDPNFEQRVYHLKYVTIGGFEASLDLPPPEQIINKQKIEKEFIQIIANNIWPIDPSLPLENRSGVYFEGGFVYVPASTLVLFKGFNMDEQTYVNCIFPENIPIRFSVDLSYMIGDISSAEPNFDYKSYLEDRKYDTDKNKFANITKHIQNQKISYFTQNNIKKYIFSFSSSIGNYLILTYFSVNFANIIYYNKKGEIVENTSTPKEWYYRYYNDKHGIIRNIPIPEEAYFKSDEEAIAFYNAIKENIRWRPDGVHVPLPEEAQGKPYFIVNDKIVPAE